MFESVFLVDQIKEDGELPSTKAYHEYIRNHRIFRMSGLQIDESLGYPTLVDGFLEQHRCSKQKPYVGATVHRAFDRIPFIWPAARYIYLVRDGRDVASSIIRMGWAGNMWHAVLPWSDQSDAEHLTGAHSCSIAQLLA